MILKKEGLVRIVSTLLFASLAVVSSRDSSLNYPGNKSQTWPIFGNCKEKDYHVSSEDTGCKCDEGCARYGKCCFDSPHLNNTKTKQASTTFKCVQTIHDDNFCLRNTCQLNQTEEETRDKCKKGDKNAIPLLDLPALSKMSPTTYHNISCNICNRNASFFFFETQMECQKYLDQRRQPREFNKGQASSEPPKEASTVMPSDFINCTILGVNLSNTSVILKACIPNLVKTCPSNLTTFGTCKKCQTYANIVTNGAEFFRNLFCAECHKKLPNKKHKSKPTACILTHRNITIFDGKYLVDTCKQEFNSCDEYGSKPYDAIAKLLYFVPEQPFLNIKDEWIKYYNYGFVLLIELTTSVLLMTLHLAVFTMSFKESTSFDKTVASLSFTELLIYSISFFREMEDVFKLIVYSNTAKTPFTCYLYSFLNQYCILAICSWMLIIPFQIWRTTRLACLKMRQVQNNNQFLTYCVFGWVVPGIIALILPLIDSVPENVVPVILKPELGVNHCLGINRKAWLASLLFIFLPAALALILSLFFLCDTIYLIYSNRFLKSSVADSAANRVVMNFRFWLKLVSLMGLGWNFVFINLIKSILKALSVTKSWESATRLLFLGVHLFFFVLTLY